MRTPAHGCRGPVVPVHGPEAGTVAALHLGATDRITEPEGDPPGADRDTVQAGSTGAQRRFWVGGRRARMAATAWPACLAPAHRAAEAERREVRRAGPAHGDEPS